MGRILYIIIGLIIILGLFAPWVNGKMFERNYTNLISEINARQDKFKINILQYDKGWLSSKAKLEVALINMSKENPPKIFIDQTISHGPLTHNAVTKKFAPGLVSMVSFFHYPDEKTLFAIKNDQGFMQADTLVSYRGHWLNQIQSPLMTLDHKGVKMTWRGLNGLIDMDVNNNTSYITSINMDVTLGPVTALGIENPFISSVEITPITIKSAVTRTDFDLWDGTSNISIPSMAVALLNGSKLTATNFNLYSQANLVESNFYDRTWQIDLKSLSIPNQFIAEIEPFSFNFSAKNLNAQGLRDYLNFMRTTDLKSITSVNIPEMMKYGAGILTPTTTFDLSLSFDTPLGDLQAQANTKFLQPVTQNIYGLLSIFQSVSQQIVIKADIRLVNKFFEMYMRNSSLIRSSIDKAPVTAMRTKTTEEMKKTVGQYLEQGKITLPMSLSIIGIIDQKLSPTLFTQQLDQLNIPTDLNYQLKQDYQIVMANQDIQTAEHPLPPSSPSTKAQEYLNSLVNNGYLLKDNHYYYASILIEKGVVKINGKDFNPLLASQMGPGPVMSIPGSISGAPSVSVPPIRPGVPPSTTPASSTAPARSTMEGPVSLPAPATTLTPASRPAPLTVPAPSTEPGQASEAAPLTMPSPSTNVAPNTFPSPTTKPAKTSQPAPASLGPQY